MSRTTVADWLEERRREQTGRAEPIDFAASAEWRFAEGALVHRTGAFFSVRGVSIEAPGLSFHDRDLPMIDQPEIGLLGFLIRRREGETHWLVQAKAEPGTVGWVQAGPTVQATRSNYLRRHGGRSTSYLSHFFASGGEAPAGVLQSEQGTRFLNKFNCNATLLVARPVEPASPAWRWFAAPEIRAALGQDYAINSDARSVIVTSPWRHLRAQGPLFTGPTAPADAPGGLRAELAKAHGMGPRPARVAAALSRLAAARQKRPIRLRTVRLEAMRGWSAESGRITPAAPDDEAPGRVEMFRIDAPAREVERWDQPFLAADTVHRAAIFLTMCEGVLEAGLRIAVEPGFRDGAQFGPTAQTDAPSPPWALDLLSGRAAPLLAVLQSDEGGRFMQTVMRYELHLLAADDLPQDTGDTIWLNPAELELLAGRRGLLTNEARSAISLLLSLA